MEAREKPDVLNLLTKRNTVGGELADIFEARGITDYERSLGVDNLRRKERLSKKTLLAAASILDNPDVVEYLTDFQAKYLEEKPKFIESYKRAKKNFSILRNALPMLKDEFNDGFDLLDDILDFFDADSEEEILTNSLAQAALYRKQNNVEPEPISLSAWLRRGEIEFSRMTLSVYDESALHNWIDAKEWERYLDDKEYFKSLPEVFRRLGVALVYVPFLPKTVYGAVRWMNGNPLVEISDRDKDLATCWYTLFHELGHVILHKDQNIYEGDTLDSKKKQTSIKEKEANTFASRYLFNGNRLRVTIFDRMRKHMLMSARSLSREFGVHTIFTSYWLRKAQYYPTMQRHISIDFLDGYPS